MNCYLRKLVWNNIRAREIKRKEGESFASEKNFLFEETSAFSGKNIKDIFTSLAADVLKRI